MHNERVNKFDPDSVASMLALDDHPDPSDGHLQRFSVWARTAIDLAVGVIMGQQRCSQAAAFEMLSKAASSRNQKLRDVAQNLLQSSDECSVQTHFDH